MSQKEAQLHPVIAVRVKPDLYAWADEQAAMEGISRSDVARRALIRDRQRRMAERRAARRVEKVSSLVIPEDPAVHATNWLAASSRTSLRIGVSQWRPVPTCARARRLCKTSTQRTPASTCALR